jgi:hypothetical protein
LQTGLHVLGIITTVVTTPTPKGAGSEDIKGKSDEETGTKTGYKSMRLSCTSCGQPTSPSKANGTTKPMDNEKPDRKSAGNADAKPGDIKAKFEEAHVDTEATESIVKQRKAHYTPLQPSSDPRDFSHYGEPETGNMYANGGTNTAQTGYADVDLSTRQVAYGDFDMQDFQ